jgi:DNA replication protein DnaC
MQEMKQCETCGKGFVHIPIMVGGMDLIPPSKNCEECSEVEWAEVKRKEREEKARKRWEDAVFEGYRDTSLAHPNFPTKVFAAAKQILREDSRPFLGFISSSGTGKSRVCAMLCKRLIWEGDYVSWAHSSAIEDAAENKNDPVMGSSHRESIKRWLTAKNLVIDDFGALKSSKSVITLVTDLLEIRGSSKKRTLWTSNETLDEMFCGLNVTPKARARIISRLGGHSRIIEF